MRINLTAQNRFRKLVSVQLYLIWILQNENAKQEMRHVMDAFITENAGSINVSKAWDTARRQAYAKYRAMGLRSWSEA